MKKKLLAALLAVLALAIAAVTVFAADTPAYTVDENGNITLDVVINLKGDVNEDGFVNYTDIQRLYQHLSTTTNQVVEYGLEIADVNEDGLVNYTDIQRLYQHLSTTDNTLW